jgi:hypothetical protein
MQTARVAVKDWLARVATEVENVTTNKLKKCLTNFNSSPHQGQATGLSARRVRVISRHQSMDNKSRHRVTLTGC